MMDTEIEELLELTRQAKSLSDSELRLEALKIVAVQDRGRPSNALLHNAQIVFNWLRHGTLPS
jgi:hypothetical protein